jgi:uncharacterized repeat protein (TIGR01451 family)
MGLKGRSFFIVFILVCCMAVTSPAADVTITLKSVWPGYLQGYAEDVALSGSNAFVAIADGGISVISVANAANPVRIGGTRTEPRADRIVTMSNYAFLASGYSMQVLDITDPGNPAVLSSNSTPSYAHDIYVQHPYVYLAEDYEGLEIFSISNPAAPVHISSITNGLNYASRVAVVSNYAYVTQSEGLRIFDVATSSAPRLVASTNIGSGNNGLCVTNDYAYLVQGYDFYVVDVSTPSDPQVVTATNMWYQSHDIAIQGSYAYLAASERFIVMDISNPALPVEAGYCETRKTAHGVEVQGNYAYVADREGGLVLVDISTPTNPLISSVARTYGDTSGVYVDGNHAYLADGDNGLQIVDISDPENPAWAGGTNLSFVAANRVEVQGSYAYVADDNGLYAVDISTPSDPQVVDHAWPSMEFHDVFLRGTNAFVTQYYDGLRIYDISDPANCNSVGYTNYITRGPNGVYVEGDYAYVASETEGLQVLDVSNVGVPVVVSTNFAGAANYVNDVYVEGTNAYLASGAYLQILDVSVPTNPVLAGETSDNLNNSLAIVVSNNYAYLASEYGLRMFDVSDGSTPAFAAGYDADGLSQDLFVRSNYVYIANGFNGLVILEVTFGSGADLVVTNIGTPGSFELGQANLVYSMSISNIGPALASNVVVSNNLPGALLFGQADTGAVAAGVFEVNLGNIDAGDWRTIRLETVPLRTGAVISTASVSTDATDPNTTNNLVTITNMIIAAADTNHNGMADWWEQYYFADPADRVPTNDFDGDGVMNIDEYEANTVPTDSNSFFSISAFTAAPSCSVTFEARTARVYFAAANTNLLESWTAIASNIPGIGQTVTIVETNMPPERSFRVRAIRPQAR